MGKLADALTQWAEQWLIEIFYSHNIRGMDPIWVEGSMYIH